MTKFDHISFLIRHLKNFRPPPLLSTPHLQKFSIPTSILRIRSLPTISTNVKASLYYNKQVIITNKLLNYDKYSSETAKNKLNLYKNSFCFRGVRPRNPPPPRARPAPPA